MANEDRANQQQMLALIDDALSAARTAATQSPDARALDIAAQGIAMVRGKVETEWPLSPATKASLGGLGAFTAKNIDDFNEPFGNVIHFLLGCMDDDGRDLRKTEEAVAALHVANSQSL